MMLLPDYILSHCRREGACLLWTGSMTNRGYPRMPHDGERVLVRRHLAELWFNDVEGAKRLSPSCGVKECLQPTHTEIKAIRRSQPHQRTKLKRKSPERARHNNLLKNYGISLVEWETLFENQGRECAICASKEPHGKNWHTDHCHKTNKVRGVLCGWCNTAIGKLQERPELFLKAIQYLGRDR